MAANLGGCIGPFSSFANQYLDVIFTAAFGVVGECFPFLLYYVVLWWLLWVCGSEITRRACTYGKWEVGRQVSTIGTPRR